jgi:hypothetical protein
MIFKKIINLTVALSRQGHDFPSLKFTALMPVLWI